LSNHSKTVPPDPIRHRILDSLPPDLGRHRILPTKEACEFVGSSVAEWRRKRARGDAPPPIMIGARKHGWRIGDLIEWIESRAQTAPVRPDEARRPGQAPAP
jgi:predicted DNA-binding transcriptional regulator AlpA